ncbi:hypothetical protein crov041 [Cafeteria roenbergensis virus]|uniref:Uncharacterized protein n=1 Tax=Cafeteria roenbergensis virus (strain BV-PW1) TaxID=693272 RepID=E3T4G1_CROVB|nr:hypothetical protein crov041 [Cafeteria roenbergensis virus BV-PW1]ADO67074.1 hypothetical protein crov041 [Cafeteria roenbergensis virus BV-PW1]
MDIIYNLFQKKESDILNNDKGINTSTINIDSDIYIAHVNDDNEESDEESDDEVVEDEHKDKILETDTIVNYLSNNILKLTPYYAISEIDPKNLDKVNFWFLNRLIDKKHVLKLQNKIVTNLDNTTYKSFLIPPIHIGVIIANDMPEFKIIDGQHRIKAIKNIIKNNPNISYPNIETYIYFCYTENQLKDLFDKINCSKNLSIKDLPIKQAAELVLKLDKYYFDKYQIRIYKKFRPYLNQQSFLKNCEEIDWEEYTVSDVIDYIKRCNRLYLKWCKNDNLWHKFVDFKKITNPKICFNKAIKCKFALGIDKDYTFLEKIKKVNKTKT